MTILAGILLLLAAVGCFAFLSNPFLDTAGTDSSIFLYVARLFNEWYVPYKDVFDQKGPLIFFVDAIGLKIADNAFWGIWLLDSFVYISAILLSFKLCIKFVEHKYAMMMIMPIAASYHLFACGGNMPEMYIIVFSLLAYNLCLTTGKVFSVVNWLLVGVCVGLIFMLKLNMITVVVPIAICWFKKTCRFKSLVCFMIGSLIAILPFFFYLFANDALNAFWEVYIEYNSQYAKPYRFFPEFNRGCMLVVIILIVNICLCFSKFLKRDLKLILFLNVVYLTVTWFVIILSGGSCRYYGPVLPACVLPISILLSLKKCIANVIVPMSILVLFAIIGQRNICYDNRIRMMKMDELLSMIEDKESVTVLGCDCLVYLHLNVRSPIRFPYQGTIANTSEFYRQRILEDIDNRKSKYLIIPDDVLNVKGALGVAWARDAVLNNYTNIFSNETYALYREKMEECRYKRKDK